MLKDNSCDSENKKIYGFTAVIISTIYIIYFSIINTVTKWLYITLAFLIQVLSVISYFDSNAKDPAAIIIRIISVTIIIVTCLSIIPGIDQIYIKNQHTFGENRIRESPIIYFISRAFDGVVNCLKLFFRGLIILSGGSRDILRANFTCEEHSGPQAWNEFIGRQSV
tara:strand:- start:221 stop:721 length:501 start_codon:yes stop_codon:yes gene_type:complete